jgi:hypothetical protein
MVNAVGVADESIRDPTEVEQPIPIGIIPSEP